MAEKAGGNAAAAKRRAEQRRREEQKPPEPVTEEILVEQTTKGHLKKLKIGDPITIANAADPSDPPKIVVARAGKQIGELPQSKLAEYLEYITQRRRMYAKVLKLDASCNYLLIEVTVR